MKVLNYFTVLSLLCSTQLLAEQKSDTLEDYLSKSKKKQFSYDYQKSEAESSKLRDSWIAPINIGYSYSKSKPYNDEQISQGANVKIDQPIFQSGGIYYGIKFAIAMKIYSDYSIDVAKRKLIKDTVSLLMQIKQTDFRIEKQNLSIKNSEINLALKREQYLSGQLDSGFLDSAVIEKNSVTQALYDIETAKERLISKFQTLSDLSHVNLAVPHLEVLTIDEFLKNNIVLKMAKSKSEQDRYNKNVTIAKYLPRLSFTAGYNWSKSENNKFSSNMGAFSEEKHYYDYGLKATMPISINTLRDVESAKVDYLKSIEISEDKKRELNAIYEQVMQNVDNLDKKKNLSEESRALYEKLLVDTQNLYSAGYKTNYDVELLKNSLAIQTIDSKVFEIDKQLELLTLYEMYLNE